jgi:hypothetical protein
MTKSKDKSNDQSIKVKVFRALDTGQWKYRTAEGIAKETHLPTEKVEATLKSHPEMVRVSLVRRSDGKLLFASKKKVSGLQDAWTAVRALSKAKFEK